MQTVSAETQEFTKEESTSLRIHANKKDSGKRVYLIGKRIFDVVFSIVFGIILVIPMAVIAGLIKLESSGPAIFKQERLGKDGKPFVMYKFRSMHPDAEKDGPRWATDNDPRCTKVGKVLRMCRADEFPQLWNIFKGEMSVVGPRPERECFYEEFEKYIPGFYNRLAVKPGLTGLAQVNGGYELKPEEKIIYDMEYIENQSFGMDLKCVFKTVKLAFTHEGAR